MPDLESGDAVFKASQASWPQYVSTLSDKGRDVPVKGAARQSCGKCAECSCMSATLKALQARD